MLSYQHIYHAGSLADVHKHTLLIRMLNVLTQKDRSITYMETHAGRGLYNLASLEAQKTGEASKGIYAVKNIDPTYMQLINKTRENFGESFYPGSPLIAQMLLRPLDEIILMELHPQEHKALIALKKQINSKMHIHKRDGYEGVLALSPPRIRRGLVLIDPSYELKDEYQQVVSFIEKLITKWPEVIVMLWYPILQAGRHQSMVADLKKIYPELLIDESLFAYSQISRMQGSGVLIFNQPSGFQTSKMVH